MQFLGRQFSVPVIMFCNYPEEVPNIVLVFLREMINDNFLKILHGKIEGNSLRNVARSAQNKCWYFFLIC